MAGGRERIAWFPIHGGEIDPEGEDFAELRGAVEMMREFTKKDKARYTRDRHLEAEWVHNTAMADARAEGRAEGAREAAKALKELGVDIDVIVKATKLSRAEVESL